MANLDSILKSRHITLPTKVRLVKAMGFPVVMYGCESWTVKKAESWRIDAFELLCWRRLLRVPWTARRSTLINPKGNQPWIFIGRTDAEAEAPIIWSLDVKSWFNGKKPWCWERLRAGGEEGDRGQYGWRALLTQWTWVWASSGRWWRTGRPRVLQSMGAQRVRRDWATEQQQITLHRFKVQKWCSHFDFTLRMGHLTTHRIFRDRTLRPKKLDPLNYTTS